MPTTPESDLAELLGKSFKPDEFRLVLMQLQYGDKLRDAIGGATPQTYFGEAVSAIKRFNAADDAFFAVLRAERPLWKDEIFRVQQRWSSAAAPSIATDREYGTTPTTRLARPFDAAAAQAAPARRVAVHEDVVYGLIADYLDNHLPRIACLDQLRKFEPVPLLRVLLYRQMEYAEEEFDTPDALDPNKGGTQWRTDRIYGLVQKIALQVGEDARETLTDFGVYLVNQNARLRRRWAPGSIQKMAMYVRELMLVIFAEQHIMLLEEIETRSAPNDPGVLRVERVPAEAVPAEAPPVGGAGVGSVIGEASGPKSEAPSPGTSAPKTSTKDRSLWDVFVGGRQVARAVKKRDIALALFRALAEDGLLDEEKIRTIRSWRFGTVHALKPVAAVSPNERADKRYHLDDRDLILLDGVAHAASTQWGLPQVEQLQGYLEGTFPSALVRQSPA